MFRRQPIHTPGEAQRQLGLELRLQNGFLKVCVTFPGPDLLRDSQEGLEGLGFYFGGYEFRISIGVNTVHVKLCETVYAVRVPLPSNSYLRQPGKRRAREIYLGSLGTVQLRTTPAPTQTPARGQPPTRK